MAYYQRRKTPEEIERICRVKRIWTICPDVMLTRRKSIHCLYNPDQEIEAQSKDLAELLDFLRIHGIENVCWRAPYLEYAMFARMKTTSNHIRKGADHG